MAIVLHVVSYYPPDRIGGVGEVVANVHAGLRAAGHRSVVVTTGTSTDDPTVLRIAKSPVRFALASVRMLQLAREADVVHIHHGEGLGLLLAMRLLRVQTPILLTLHVNVGAMIPSMRPYRAAGRALGATRVSDFLYTNIVMPVRELMDRAARLLSDSVSFISQSAARDTLGTERATVIYNGIAPAIQSPSAHAPTDLLFVGTNSLRKRVEMLPLVLAIVRKQRPTATLRIVGLTREDNPELTALAQSLGVLDAIVFEGRKRSEELGAYYAASKVLLMPSAYEGLPMVILEAFSHGLPCVATDVSGHPEVISAGENGFLVPVDNPQAMADAALRILRDAALAAKMSAASRSVVATKFSVARQVNEYLALYAHLRRPA